MSYCNKNVANAKENMSIIRVILPLAKNGKSARDALDLGIAFKDQAIKAGGNGRVFRRKDSVQVDLEGLTSQRVDELTHAYGDSLIKHAGEAKIATVVVPNPHLPPGIMPGEHVREKLTRKFLFSLPVGVFIVSNVANWVAELTARTDRQRLWEQAVARGVAQRLASVFWTKDDCLR